MENLTLKQFRNQLADWIESRLASGQLPFQRLSSDLTVVTASGQSQADLVLWINRHSLITGSIMLFPKQIDSAVLTRGTDLARSLGLGHFVTWGAREVTIWKTGSEPSVQMTTLPVPSAKDIRPSDFHTLLNQLLNTLKSIAITTALSTDELSPHYYLNLCLIALDDLLPDLAAQARMRAAGNHPDHWISQIPIETAWLSLWRILALIWLKQMPPGMQPERLEQAILYALGSLPEKYSGLSQLQEKQDEPDLGDRVAVRLHHLASRLKQLGWPQNPDQATDLVRLLLTEAASDLGLNEFPVPWTIRKPVTSINIHPAENWNMVWVAPRPYLAGMALVEAMTGKQKPLTRFEQITSLAITSETPSIFAQPLGEEPPERDERERRLLNLRQVWPNRRFELSRKMPAYLWEAIHLVGVQANPGEICLAMPCNWMSQPGSQDFWRLACERYSLEAVTEVPGQKLLLQLNSATDTLQIHRSDGNTLHFPAHLLTGQSPGVLNVYLCAPDGIIEMLLNERLSSATENDTKRADILGWGLWVFTRTSLGGYLWDLIYPNTGLPEYPAISLSVQPCGLPLPSEAILTALGQLGRYYGRQLPSSAKLDQELQALMGPIPQLPSLPQSASQLNSERRRRQRGLTEEIAAIVFSDGIPRFPDHYLMHHFQPKVQTIAINGPLSIAETFFDQTRLIGPDNFSLQITSLVKAEVLIFASHTGAQQVKVPEDDELGRDILNGYRADLERLWQQLLRECRNRIPRRQAALTLARRIWQNGHLPPPELFSA